VVLPEKDEFEGEIHIQDERKVPENIVESDLNRDFDIKPDDEQSNETLLEIKEEPLNEEIPQENTDKGFDTAPILDDNIISDNIPSNEESKVIEQNFEQSAGQDEIKKKALKDNYLLPNLYLMLSSSEIHFNNLLFLIADFFKYEKLKAVNLALERSRLEEKQKAQKQIEARRKEQEKIEVELQEQERKEAERKEQERIEAEHKEQERRWRGIERKARRRKEKLEKATTGQVKIVEHAEEDNKIIYTSPSIKPRKKSILTRVKIRFKLYLKKFNKIVSLFKIKKSK
jgi:hypothetical protein